VLLLAPLFDDSAAAPDVRLGDEVLAGLLQAGGAEVGEEPMFAVPVAIPVDVPGVSSSSSDPSTASDPGAPNPALPSEAVIHCKHCPSNAKETLTNSSTPVHLKNVCEDHLPSLTATPSSSASPKFLTPIIGLLRFLPPLLAQDSVHAFPSDSIVVECLQIWPMAECLAKLKAPSTNSA
jgi:hypothetical protein